MNPDCPEAQAEATEEILNNKALFEEAVANYMGDIADRLFAINKGEDTALLLAEDIASEYAPEYIRQQNEDGQMNYAEMRSEAA